MDAQRARNLARLCGFALLVVFAVVFASMQRALTVVRLKAEKEGKLPSGASAGKGTVDTGPVLAASASASAATAAREFLGPRATIVTTMDFERDGVPESIAVVPASGSLVSSSGSLATQVGVIGLSATGRPALLFDSVRASDLPPHPDARAIWRVVARDRTHLDIEPVGPAGESRGIAYRVEMEPRTGHLRALPIAAGVAVEAVPAITPPPPLAVTPTATGSPSPAASPGAL